MKHTTIQLRKESFYSLLMPNFHTFFKSIFNICCNTVRSHLIPIQKEATSF